MQILLVEDDLISQEIVGSILHTQGLTADVASDGFAALRMLREKSYQLALVDYHLPEMDGFALAKLMRDIGKTHTQSLRLVGLTADRNGLAARQGVDGIFDEILAKPFDPQELVSLVERELEAVASRQRASKAAAFMAKPDFHSAQQASVAFWEARGIDGLPKAAVFPTPTHDQATALQMTFEVVDNRGADLVILLDARGLHELIRSRLDTSDLPVITLDRSLLDISDAYFDVSDLASWSCVAGLVSKKVSR